MILIAVNNDNIRATSIPDVSLSIENICILGIAHHLASGISIRVSPAIHLILLLNKTRYANRENFQRNNNSFARIG